jgi:DNA-binding NarL/FixJ family response regulator
MSLRLLIADDHQLVREGMRSLLERAIDGVEVVEAKDGHDAVSIAAQMSPDVVLMDIQMPGLNGLDATRQIVRDRPDSKVIVLSIHRDEEHMLQAMRAGASAYLAKDVGVAELTAAIGAVNRGEPCADRMSSRVSRVLDRSATETSPVMLLSGRQREILQLIAEGHSTKEIAFRLGLSAKTVETHRRLLMQRLEIFDVAGLARFAVRSGLVSAER